MRGKVGDKLTIQGDWLYDWAKIYQSLIGYDEILLSKPIDDEYKERTIDIFKDYFINMFSDGDFNNLKVITKSLIFALIPLHDNANCTKYYNLLFFGLFKLMKNDFHWHENCFIAFFVK